MIRPAVPLALLLWGLLIILALPLVGCATPGPKLDTSIAPKEVRVEVSKACVPADVAPPPAGYPDDALTAASQPEDRYLAVAAANQLRKGRLAAIEPVLAGCRK